MLDGVSSEQMRRAGEIYLEDAEELVLILRKIGRTPVQSVSTLLVALSMVILDSEGPTGERVALSRDAGIKLGEMVDAVAAARGQRSRDRAMGKGLPH